jgi:hypothetical protein
MPVHVVWPVTLTCAPATGPVSVAVTVPEIIDVPTGMRRSLGSTRGASRGTGAGDLTITCAPAAVLRHTARAVNAGQLRLMRDT